MATQVQALTATAVVDLTDIASMSDGDGFRIEAQGGSVRLYEGSAAPDLDTTPQVYITELREGGVYWHTQGTENLYAWAPRGSCRVSINDAE